MKHFNRIKIFILFSVIVLFTSLFLDDIIADNIHFPSMPIIIASQPILLGLMAFTILFLIFKKFGARFTLLSGILIGAILLATQVIKLLTERLRPSEYTFDFSFPSGHSSFTFALVPLAFTHSKRAGYIMLIIASIIALSRILLKEHYLSDVIAGSILGYTLSWVYINMIGRDDNNEHEKK